MFTQKQSAPNLAELAVSDVLLHLLEDEPGTEVVLCIDSRQFGDVVAVSAPFHFCQVHIVRDAIIMERSKQPGVQGSRKAYFGRDVSVEENRDVLLLVCTLRRCRKTQQYPRLEMGHQLDVGGSHDVMDLIDHHIVVEILGELQMVQAVAQRVLAGKDVLIAGGFVVAVPQTAEVGVFEHDAEGEHGLTKDFLTMGDEEKTAVGMGLTKAFEVEGGNDGLSRARGSHHKVAEMAVHVSLHIQPFQYLLLIVLGAHEVERREIEQGRFPVCS